MTITFNERFNAARRVSVPLVGIETPDPGATIKSLAANNANVPAPPNGDSWPVIRWDVVQGIAPCNESGKKLWQKIKDQTEWAVPVEFLNTIVAATQGVGRVIVCMQGANEWLQQPGPSGIAIRQAVWNVRDEFKRDGRTLVLLDSTIQVPANLQNDVIVLEEPLPDAGQLSEMVSKLDQQVSRCACGGKKDCKKCKGTGMSVKRPAAASEAVEKVVEAVKGLSAFGAEQVVSMALRPETVKGQAVSCGIDIDHCWASKRKLIEQTSGLSIYRGGETFKDLGGLEQIKTYLSRIMTGRKPPKVIVWLDEIEKTGLAATGDSSGVNRDQEGTLLSWMEDHDVFGIMLLGVPGCLAEDTIVQYNRGERTGGRSLTIGEFCSKFNGPFADHGNAGVWQPGIPTYLHSYDEKSGVVGYNKVEAVWCAGDKPCLRICCDNGDSVTLTTDHPVLTEHGFVNAGDLAVGDRLLVKTSLLPNKVKPKKARMPRAEMSGLTHHPYARTKPVRDPKSGKIYEYKRVARARLALEAYINDLSLTEYVRVLKTDPVRSASFCFIPRDYDVHHRDEDALNDDPDNLTVETHAGHTGRHTGVETFNIEYTRTVSITSIEDVGVKRTYDIRMESPRNNFAVNGGIIVHNCGKSAICKAVGAEFERVVIRIDLGAMQGSLVGESQQNLRQALKVIEGVGGDSTMWLATSNSIRGLSQAFKSRFVDVFFFDLPTPEEREPVWRVWLDKFGLDDAPYTNDDSWVPRNIKHCCDKAFRMNLPVSEVASYITPVGLVDREKVQELRQDADCRYLSASHEGVFRMPDSRLQPERSLSLE